MSAIDECRSRVAHSDGAPTAHSVGIARCPQFRPGVIRILRHPPPDGVCYIRMEDANGNKVAAFSTNASVGGRGLELTLADAQLIVALANSPAATAFVADARHHALAEILRCQARDQVPRAAATAGRSRDPQAPTIASSHLV